MRNLIAVAFCVYPLLVMMLGHFKMARRKEQVASTFFVLYAVVCCALFAYGRHHIASDVQRGVLLSSFLSAYMQVALSVCTSASEEQRRLTIRQIMGIVTIAVLAIVAILMLYDFLLGKYFL